MTVRAERALASCDLCTCAALSAVAIPRTCEPTRHIHHTYRVTCHTGCRTSCCADHSSASDKDTTRTQLDRFCFFRRRLRSSRVVFSGIGREERELVTGRRASAGRCDWISVAVVSPLPEPGVPHSPTSCALPLARADRSRLRLRLRSGPRRAAVLAGLDGCSSVAARTEDWL